MAITKENSAQGIATRNTDLSRLRENWQAYCLTMAFADELLERGGLSPENYADFAIENAQFFDLNLCNLMH